MQGPAGPLLRGTLEEGVRTAFETSLSYLQILLAGMEAVKGALGGEGGKHASEGQGGSAVDEQCTGTLLSLLWGARYWLLILGAEMPALLAAARDFLPSGTLASYDSRISALWAATIHLPVLMLLCAGCSPCIGALRAHLSGVDPPVAAELACLVRWAADGGLGAQSQDTAAFSPLMHSSRRVMQLVIQLQPMAVQVAAAAAVAAPAVATGQEPPQPRAAAVAAAATSLLVQPAVVPLRQQATRGMAVPAAVHLRLVPSPVCGRSCLPVRHGSVCLDGRSAC